MKYLYSKDSVAEHQESNMRSLRELNRPDSRSFFWYIYLIMKNTNSIKKIALALFPATLMFAHSAAAEIHYDFIEAVYVRAESEFGNPVIDDETSIGLGISGSYSINDNVAVGARFGTINLDTTAQFENTGRGPLELESTVYGVFGRFHAPLNDQADYYVGGAFEKIKSEANGPNGVPVAEFGGNSDGKGLFAGVRYQYNEQVELEGRITYDLDADDGEDEIDFSIGGRYMIVPTIAIGVEFEPGDSGDILRFSVRKNLDI